MSRPQTPEPALDAQGDSPTGSRDEDAADGTQHSHRMLNFSDALLSIIATVMILPVTHTEISPEQQFDRSIQKLLATRIAVYLMTFLIVTVAWAAHTRLFQVVAKIDDTLALLNLACMMTITFLPFTVIFLNGDLPRGAPGHSLVLCVRDRHRGRAGADRAVRLPLPPPPEPPDSALRAPGPVPAAHPAHRAPRPRPVLRGRGLLPVLLPGVLPADGDSRLPPLRQQGRQLVQRQARGPRGAPRARRGGLHLRPAGASQQGAGGGLQRRRLCHRGHAPHSGHLRAQRAGAQGRGGAVPGQPAGGAARGGAALPGLLRLLRHGGAAVVRAPLAVPARAQGHAGHGAAEHAVAGLRGRPAAGLPADVGLRAAAPRRAGARARQLRHRLLRQRLPARHVDHGAAARRRRAAARGALRRRRARPHAGQARAVPLRQPAGLRLHLLPERLQRRHLPRHADRRALRLPAAAAAGAPGPGPPAHAEGPRPARAQRRGRPGCRAGPAAPCRRPRLRVSAQRGPVLPPPPPALRPPPPTPRCPALTVSPGLGLVAAQGPSPGPHSVRWVQRRPQPHP